MMQRELVSFLIAYGGGLFLWTFLEYVLHNWLGHLPKGRHVVSREHLRHHTTPTYFSPFAKKVVLAGPILSAVALVGSPLWGLGAGLGLVGGVVTGWVFYEVVHRRLHTHAPRGWYGRWARRNHLHHHFCAPHLNHGVTSPLWDFVFRTHQRPGVIRVPRKHVGGLPWLTMSGPWEGEYRVV